MQELGLTKIAIEYDSFVLPAVLHVGKAQRCTLSFGNLSQGAASMHGFREESMVPHLADAVLSL